MITPKKISICNLSNKALSKRTFGNQELACFIDCLVAKDGLNKADENGATQATPVCNNDACSVNKLCQDTLEHKSQDLDSKTNPILLILELTYKEAEIFFRLISPDPTKVIAKKMGISHHTVADYTQIIYQKLHVNSRIECIYFLKQHLKLIQQHIAQWQSDL